MTITTQDKLRCAEREVSYRHRVYGRLVQRGKMSQLEAWREIETMAAIAEDYRALGDDDVPQLFIEPRMIQGR